MMKKCKTCDTEKSLDSFYKRSGTEVHLPNCKSCVAEYNTTLKVSRAAASKKWQTNNKEQYNEYHRAYRKDNPEKIKAIATRSRNTEYGMAAHSARCAAYRASKLNATPVWLTEEQEDDIKSMYLLAKKFEKLCNIKYHVDHIVPLQGENVCGLHVPWNLQLLPASVNISKSNKYDPQDNSRYA